MDIEVASPDRPSLEETTVYLTHITCIQCVYVIEKYEYYGVMIAESVINATLIHTIKSNSRK